MNVGVTPPGVAFSVVGQSGGVNYLATVCSARLLNEGCCVPALHGQRS